GSFPFPISFLSLRLRPPLFSTSSTRSLATRPLSLSAPSSETQTTTVPPSQPSSISMAVASSRPSTSALGRFASLARSCNASRWYYSFSPVSARRS
ncbi:hypothetical protein BHM03_00041278, partial [Ensete ventricosum]